MRFKKLRKTSYKDSESYDNIMIKREYLNGFIEYDNRKEERCMRKMRTLFLVLLCCGLSLYAGVSYVKAEEKVPSDYDAYLQETGMPENEIQKLDEHVKQFIVDDLKNGDGKFEYMKIDVGKQAMNGREEDFEWIEFYASAFQIGSTIYIYPTYEFAENKKPCGNDSFSFLLGEAIRPYEFGGTLWYKDRTMSDWEVSGNLIANNQQLNGASYSGSQLGTPRSAMKFMGTTYCHASVGTGDDNRILMGYSYQPKEVRVELFGWRLSRKQIIFVMAGGVVVGSVWWRKNKGKTQK